MVRSYFDTLSYFGNNKEKKRKPTTTGKKLFVLRAQDNACAKCKEKFRATDRPHLHHKDGNSKNDNI